MNEHIILRDSQSVGVECVPAHPARNAHLPLQKALVHALPVALDALLTEGRNSLDGTGDVKMPPIQRKGPEADFADSVFCHHRQYTRSVNGLGISTYQLGLVAQVPRQSMWPAMYSSYTTNLWARLSMAKSSLLESGMPFSMKSLWTLGSADTRNQVSV